MQDNDDQLLRELINIVGQPWATNDPEVIYAYSRDVNLYPDNLLSVIRPPFYVVLPGTPEELQKVMAIANKFQAPMTIQATGINICGMCVPPRGGILLDLKRMDRLDVELAQLEREQLRVDSASDGKDSKFIAARLEQVRKRQSELEKNIVKRNERSVDLETRGEELKQLQQIAKDMNVKLEQMDIDNQLPGVIRQLSPAVITNQNIARQ